MRIGFSPEGEDRTAHQCEIGSGIAGAAAAFVLKEGQSVAGVVVFVFNVPATPDFSGELLWADIALIGQEQTSSASELRVFFRLAHPADLYRQTHAGKANLGGFEGKNAHGTFFDPTVRELDLQGQKGGEAFSIRPVTMSRVCF